MSPLFVPRAARSYWCQLCPAKVPNRVARNRHARQHPEAVCSRGEWTIPASAVEARAARTRNAFIRPLTRRERTTSEVSL